jgi:hypothetical protein
LAGLAHQPTGLVDDRGVLVEPRACHGRRARLDPQPARRRAGPQQRRELHGGRPADAAAEVEDRWRHDVAREQREQDIGRLPERADPPAQHRRAPLAPYEGERRGVVAQFASTRDARCGACLARVQRVCRGLGRHRGQVAPPRAVIGQPPGRDRRGEHRPAALVHPHRDHRHRPTDLEHLGVQLDGPRVGRAEVVGRHGERVRRRARRLGVHAGQPGTGEQHHQQAAMGLGADREAGAELSAEAAVTERGQRDRVAKGPVGLDAAGMGEWSHRTGVSPRDAAPRTGVICV